MSYRVETVAGSSRIGDGGPPLAAQFSAIQGIAVDRLGNLYLSDTDNHRVRKVSGGVVTTIAGTGVAGFSGDGKTAVDAQLNLPYGVALDSAGNLYVADLGNHRVRRISPDGMIATVAGTGRRASSPDGAPPTETSLLSPRNVAVDAAGNLYIAEFEGHRVRRLTPDGRLSTVAGTGVAGWSGDGRPRNLPPRSAIRQAWRSIAPGRSISPIRAINAVRKIVRRWHASAPCSAATRPPPCTPPWPSPWIRPEPSTWETPRFVVRAFTTGRQVDHLRRDRRARLLRRRRERRQRRAHLGQRPGHGPQRQPLDRRRRARAAGGHLAATSLPWRAMATCIPSAMAGPPRSAQLYQPSALALDSAGNLFIADSGTQRVRQVARTAPSTTLAGTGTAARGAPMEAPPATSRSTLPWASPWIRPATCWWRTPTITASCWSPPRAPSARVAGTGTGRRQSRGHRAADGAIARSARASAPTTPAMCTSWTPATTAFCACLPAGAMQTAAGNGSKGSAGDEGAARLAQLNAPSACATDSAGNLFIADTGNHAIRKVSPAGLISTVAGSGRRGRVGRRRPGDRRACWLRPAA